MKKLFKLGRQIKKQAKDAGLDFADAEVGKVDGAYGAAKKAVYDKYVRAVDAIVLKGKTKFWDIDVRLLKSFHNKMLAANKREEYWVESKRFHAVLDYFPVFFQHSRHGIVRKDVKWVKSELKPFFEACCIEEINNTYSNRIGEMKE